MKISDPGTIQPDSLVKQVSPAEAVLNWQLENAVAQNKILKRIEQSQQN